MAKNADRFPPAVADFLKAEREILVSRLGASRAILRTHAGEMGTSLEHEARSFLRSFLPHEYGLGRGLVAWREECGQAEATWSPGKDQYFRLRVSPQLDIIIYDAVRGGPIAELGSAQLFPIEDVYGYVEVKTAFTEKLAKTLNDSKIMRANSIGVYAGRPEAFRESMSDAFWAKMEKAMESDPGRANRVIVGKATRPRLSCWMLAFEYEPAARRKKALTDDEVKESFEEVWRGVGNYAHLSGALIVNMRTKGASGDAFLRSIPDATQHAPFKAELVRSNPIGKFKEMLLIDLAAFERRSLGLSVCYPGYWDS